MKRYCKISGIEFEITSEEASFYDRMGVPPPQLAPLERQRRRTIFRNFRQLYHRACNVTGKRIISMYDERAPFPVYDNDVWWSDQWEAKSFGQQFDFASSFFEQYKMLSDRVPRFAIMNLQSENCNYSNMTLQSRNCYLVFGCVRTEDCLYGHIVWDCGNCIDCLYAYRCQWCSNSVDVVDCYDVHYSVETTNCQESYFLHDCSNCQNCFGCSNMRSKQYCFFNEQCTKEEYTRRLAKVLPLTEEGLAYGLTWLEEQRRQSSYPSMFGLKNEDVTGNHIYESKNLHYCFDAKKCENARYCFTAFGVENSADISFTGGHVRFALDSLTLSFSEEILFSHIVSDTNNAAYCQFCYSCHDIFGCIGLRNSEYCILNKQYSKDEYFSLRARIVEHMNNAGEWGEFFPAAHSPFAYNESIAHEYMPLTPDEARKRGLRWKDKEVINMARPNTSRIPAVAQTTDDVLTQIFICADTNKPFKIIAPELAFYRRMNLPLPRVCPEARHLARMKVRAIRQLAQRFCDSCGKSEHTAHDSTIAKTMLCEECYLRAMY